MNVSFGEFTLDTDTRQLLRGQQDVHLSPKAFQLLSLLVRSRPSVVDRTVLRDHLWPDTHVVDAALGNLIAEIRGAMGERGSAFVRTAHGVGYAFSGETRESGGTAPAPAQAARRHWLVWNDRAIVLQQTDNILGRDPACSIWIDAPGVSRRHARICVPESSGKAIALLEDLGSTNGTYLGGKQIAGTVPLDDGDVITLGEATVTFRAWRDSHAVTKRVKPPKR